MPPARGEVAYFRQLPASIGSVTPVMYDEAGLAPWDLAAGEIIAREAGATVTDLDGGPVHAGSVLACSPALHEPFLDLLGALGPPD